MWFSRGSGAVERGGFFRRKSGAHAAFDSRLIEVDRSVDRSEERREEGVSPCVLSTALIVKRLDGADGGEGDKWAIN